MVDIAKTLEVMEEMVGTCTPDRFTVVMDIFANLSGDPEFQKLGWNKAVRRPDMDDAVAAVLNNPVETLVVYLEQFGFIHGLVLSDNPLIYFTKIERGLLWYTGAGKLGDGDGADITRFRRLLPSSSDPPSPMAKYIEAFKAANANAGAKST